MENMLLYIRVNQKFMGKPYEGPERRSSKREGEIREIDIRGAAARVIRDGHALSDADFTEGPVMESAIRDKLLTTLGSSIDRRNMPTEAAQANRNLAPVEEEVIDPADIIDSSDVPINRDKSYKAQFEHFLRNISQSSSVSIKIFELFSLYPLGTKLKSAQIAHEVGQELSSFNRFVNRMKNRDFNFLKTKPFRLRKISRGNEQDQFELIYIKAKS